MLFFALYNSVEGEAAIGEAPRGELNLLPTAVTANSGVERGSEKMIVAVPASQDVVQTLPFETHIVPQAKAIDMHEKVIATPARVVLVCVCVCVCV